MAPTFSAENAGAFHFVTSAKRLAGGTKFPRVLPPASGGERTKNECECFASTDEEYRSPSSDPLMDKYTRKIPKKHLDSTRFSWENIPMYATSRMNEGCR
jgi:hypothetical protein